ncbi:hypothetical protein DPMN_007961 [Dreissena polymorpha]|uniref:Uncharacterized protein n=1 Tax=Dreissena polymorpha TaxID=45954 RepID=A0A9D4MXX3_DREPO|nr:hypothetical protein DPMN_007961 [Dreissena polymorpha]
MGGHIYFRYDFNMALVRVLQDGLVFGLVVVSSAGSVWVRTGTQLRDHAVVSVFAVAALATTWRDNNYYFSKPSSVKTFLCLSY